MVRTKKYRRVAVVRLCQFERPSSFPFFSGTGSDYGKNCNTVKSFRQWEARHGVAFQLIRPWSSRSILDIS